MPGNGTTNAAWRENDMSSEMMQFLDPAGVATQPAWFMKNPVCESGAHQAGAAPRLMFQHDLQLWPRHSVKLKL